MLTQYRINVISMSDRATCDVGPTLSHTTLVQCWTNVMRKLAIHWANVGPTRWGNIGPMSKITLGQRHLPTLAQCNWLHWPNVGPTLACYLGCYVDIDLIILGLFRQYLVYYFKPLHTCRCELETDGIKQE